MSRYIDAEALKEYIMDGIEETKQAFIPDGSKALRAARVVTSSFLRGIDEQPTADVRENVHGEWDTSGRYMFADGRVAVRCKNCGCTITAEEYNRYVWNFCPVCGADMRGEKDE